MKNLNKNQTATQATTNEEFINIMINEYIENKKLDKEKIQNKYNEVKEQIKVMENLEKYLKSIKASYNIFKPVAQELKKLQEQANIISLYKSINNN